MNKVSQDFYEKELKTLSTSKKPKVFVIAFVVVLFLFSYLGYLMLTKDYPVSESNFFDSFGYEYNKK